MAWWKKLLGGEKKHAVIFMHAYPSEHGSDAEELSRLLQESGVLLVEMGHTHYNELASDGHTIYAATRSTGQVEEGPAGFSVTTVDDGVVSWKFKPIGDWPLVMVTSPADCRLITDPRSPTQVERGPIQVRARVWGPSIAKVTIESDGGNAPMKSLDESTWSADWGTRLSNGLHVLTVTALAADGRSGRDSITVLVDRDGRYEPPPRRDVDYENALGAWPEKHILGTQLGPNENGRHWPSRRARKSPVSESQAR